MESSQKKIREILWPIHGIEHKKFIPLALMMFCILFNYSMLRSIKDGLVVTAIGAEALGFLKTYFVLPSAILAMLAYSSLCNIMNPQKVFYVIAGFFVTYIALFGLVLFPNIEFFNLKHIILPRLGTIDIGFMNLYYPSFEMATIDQAIGFYPRMKWFIKIFQNWSYSSLYVVAELWGSMMLSLLFWQYANQVTKPEEAKRFYSMFGVLGNVGLILSGYVLTSFLGEHATGDKVQNFMSLLMFSVASGLTVMGIYAWSNNNVLTDPRLYDPNSKSTSKKKKAKLSLSESFKMIASSKYLALIAVLLLAYGISINLIEGVWKDKIKALYSNKESYTSFMGRFQSYQGITAIFFMVVGTNILRLVSWTTAAIITPLMVLVTGFLFFFFIYAAQSDAPLFAYLMFSDPLYLAVMVGMVQNILSKATKYSLFDSTQKMAYMPLDDELKTKGMAAVEVVGGRLGKSGGGLIQSSVFFFFPYTFVEATPIFATICALIVVAWTFAVVALGKEFSAAMAEQQKDQ